MAILSKEKFDEKEKISHQMRGSILARFAILEVGIQEFVLSSFLNEQDSTNHSKLFENLHSGIFQNTFFNFSLLRDLFEKILEKNPAYATEYKTRYSSALFKLYEIRNIAAHGMPEINNASEIERGSKKIIIASDQSEFCIRSGHLNPPWYDETVESLYKRFNENYDKTSNFINGLPGVKYRPITVS
jgi:hypothetical protein